MSGYVVVDASVWVARLIEGDSFHGVSRGWLEEERKKEVIFLAPSLLLVEVSGAIGRRTGEPDLARRALSALGKLADLRLVAMDENLVQGAAQLAGELGLRGADAFYVAVARQLNVPLATLDQDQRERAKEMVSLKVIDEGGS